MSVPAGPTGLVDVTDVRDYLGQNQTGAPVPSEADTRLLQQMIDAATPIIERLAGPCLPTPYLERHDGEDELVVLYHYPVLTIDSCREFRYGAGVETLVESTPDSPVDGYQLEAETGTLIRVFAGGFVKGWWPGSRNIEIAYTAGRADVPPNVAEATKTLIAHWWKLRRGGTGRLPGGGMEGANGFVVPSYGVPNRVREILAGDAAAPNLG
jgi:hypothetical protein